MTLRPSTSLTGARSRNASPPPPHSRGMWGASMPISRTRDRRRSISLWAAPKPRSRTVRSTARTSSSTKRRTRAMRSRTFSGMVKSMALSPGGSLSPGGDDRVQLPVVQLAEEDLCRERADQGEEHVPLGVPDVALGAEEVCRGRAADHGGPPFDELVEGAEGEAGAGDQEEEPAVPLERGPAQQHLADQDGRHEALGEVAQAVVVVAGEAQEVAHPEAERHPGVGIVPAEHQDQGVEEEKTVDERRQ